MKTVTERFLRYVSFDTQSEEEQEQIPSTAKQLKLAEQLGKELREMGAEEVRVTEHGYVYASLPSNTDRKVKAVGFISHMDTAPAMSGTGVKPRIVEHYDGSDIVLNKELGIVMKTADFPHMKNYQGKDLIVTDGTTLLGADDKAGVAEIMTLAAYLLAHPEIKHGPIRIGFTPDEEVGRGADLFDVEGFQADVAYTVDGEELGEIEYENFNAASARVQINGVSIHPGSAKNRMKNAILMGMEFQQLLPVFENPMYTEGYEGFYHLNEMKGTEESARLSYIIRDHNREKFEEKKAFMEKCADFMNEKYGEGTVTIQIQDSYYNMKELVEPHHYLIDIACDAMKELGVDPIIVPIRGGTDGARLSYMGLPCPNLCAGGTNIHGKFEFCAVQDLEQITAILLGIVKRFAEME